MHGLVFDLPSTRLANCTVGACLHADISVQDLAVVYDNEKEQIGWARASCDRLPKSATAPLLLFDSANQLPVEGHGAAASDLPSVQLKSSAPASLARADVSLSYLTNR